MSSISLMERAKRIDRVREEIRARRKEHPKLYSWSNLEQDISNAAGFQVSRTAIRQFVGGGKPGRDELWLAYDAWGVREGVLEDVGGAPEGGKGAAAELGRKIRGLRDAAGMSQGELGAEVGVDQSTISRLENGSLKDPERPLVAAIFRALGAEASSDNAPRDTPALTPSPTGDPAERIIWYVQQATDYARATGVVKEPDMVAMAYAMADREGVDAEEYRKIGAWRDQILKNAPPKP